MEALSAAPPRWRLFFCLMIACAPGITRAAPPERPNIVYILCDDLGYGDLGCYGQRRIRTPNIDRLAAQGLRFTNHYAGHTVCRPSRLSLWTGKHTGHTAISSNAAYSFRPDDITVAELLRQAGYVTGGVGKWAMGGAGTTGDPLENGFDFWMGYLDQGAAHNYYPEFLWLNGEKVPLAGNEEGPTKRVSTVRTTYSHDRMTEAALDFIRQNRHGPFLLHVHWTIPHANNERGRALGDGMEVPDHDIYRDRDWPPPEKGFAAMVTRMDGDVGRIVALLEDLDIARRTLVVFTSDNGPHAEGGHDHAFFDSNGPLRGYKRDLYEGGIRVPLIAWWPGKVAANAVTDHLSAFWDFLPTACELAGVTPPDEIDGLSYLPTLLGEREAQRQHDHLYWQFRGKRAVRQGRWKAVRAAARRPLELYDLEADIGETEDLAASRPEVAARLAGLIERGPRPQDGFRFRHAFVDADLPGDRWGQTALGDIDGDGDLDFVTGRAGGEIRWYEFRGKGTWESHRLAERSPSDVGGALLDVDLDGRLDFVAGGAWYRQPDDARTGLWTSFTFDPDLRAVHDLITCDLDGDGREDVVSMSDRNDLRWYRIAAAPEARWQHRFIATPVHAGLAAGDIDRDGDIDLVRASIWIENLGQGAAWREHGFCGLAWADAKDYPGAARSRVADINRDGRPDIVLTENEMPDGRVVWFEAPADPRQIPWRPHILSSPGAERRGPHHSLAVADFDGDGDLDVFSGEMEWLATPPHRWFIWENSSGDGAHFVEHVILDRGLGTHEAVAGDVDGDGDIDIIGKLWRPVADNANAGKNHVDFLENLLSNAE